MIQFGCLLIQMAETSSKRDKSVIGKHVRNIFKEGELAKESVWAKICLLLLLMVKFIKLIITIWM